MKTIHKQHYKIIGCKELVKSKIIALITALIKEIKRNALCNQCFDESGKLVYFSSMQDEKQIDLSNLSIDTYLIELYNEKMKSIQKTLKSK
jgi:hypothetical protein